MNYRKWYAYPLMVTNRLVASRLRKSKWLTRRIFDVDVFEGDRPQYWDYTTLILRKSLADRVPSGSRVLEIGVGENAILSQSLAKTKSVKSFGVDLEPNVLALARKSAAHNGTEIDLRHSDMFSACDGKFDVIFWNPPYVPRDVVATGIVGAQSAIESDGGADGTDLISRFLSEAPDWLTPKGEILLGFSAFYVTLDRMKELIGERITLVEVIEAKPNPSKVLAIRHVGVA